MNGAQTNCSRYARPIAKVDITQSIWFQSKIQLMWNNGIPSLRWSILPACSTGMFIRCWLSHDYHLHLEIWRYCISSKTLGQAGQPWAGWQPVSIRAAQYEVFYSSIKARSGNFFRESAWFYYPNLQKCVVWNVGGIGDPP